MRKWAITLLNLSMSLGVYAGSSKIPSKNPFRDEGVGALANSLNNPAQTKIYFSGNVSGMREGCGCSAVPKGGLERRFNFLKKEGLLSKMNDSVLLDFGNLLFKSAVFAKSDEKEALLNAEKMIAATNLFPFAAINFGALDRTVDPERLSKLFASSQIPWLASNIFPSNRIGGRIRRRVPLKLQDAELVIFGLSSMDEKLSGYGWRVEKAATVLEKELSDLSENVFPIVLSDLELSELTPIAQAVKRPVLFLGSRETGGWDKPLEVGQALLVHLRQQGQEWGVFKFSPQQKAKKGWFNPRDSEALAKRWDELKTEAQALEKFAASKQKDIEIENVKSKMQELTNLAPTNHDLAYSFETIEMNEVFNGKNQVSKFMK